MLAALAANLCHDIADALRVEVHATPSGKMDEEVSRYQKSLDRLDEERQY